MTRRPERGRARALLGPFVALRHAGFAVVALGNFVSALGTWSQIIGIGWAAQRLSGSAFLVGVAFGAQFFPTLLAAPFGGVIADRYDRRTVTIIGNVGMALPAAAMGWLVHVDALTVPWLIGLALVGGTFGALTQPSMAALVPALVPTTEIGAAVSVNSILQNLSRFAGATLAGVLIAAYGTETAFLFNAVSFVAVVAAWLLVRPTVPRSVPRHEPFRHRLAGGLQYARRNPMVRNLLLLNVAVSIFIVQQPLLPVITEQLLESDSRTYGLLNSATGLGSMIGAFVAGRAATRTHRRAVTLSVALMAVTIALVGVSRSVPLSVAAEVVYGVGLFVVLTISMSRVVLATEDEYLGRVMALQSMASGGIVPINAIVAGFIASALGLSVTIVGAAAGLACFLAVFAGMGALRALDEGPDELVGETLPLLDGSPEPA
jgi:MFS family permease